MKLYGTQKTQREQRNTERFMFKNSVFFVLSVDKLQEERDGTQKTQRKQRDTAGLFF
jgi:hypothetical protein